MVIYIEFILKMELRNKNKKESDIYNNTFSFEIKLIDSNWFLKYNN